MTPSQPRNIEEVFIAIVNNCRHGSFSDAEDLFKTLCDMIHFEPVPYERQQDNEWIRHYSSLEIDRFQRAISTLVRYAPTIQDGLDYGCFCLYQVPEPLRDESLERVLTTNLIYLYKQQGGHENYTKALGLIKSGVETGYALPFEHPRTFASNSHYGFVRESRPVLRFFGLDLSQDKKSVVSSSSPSHS